jgi:hypothetical protein
VDHRPLPFFFAANRLPALVLGGCHPVSQAAEPPTAAPVSPTSPPTTIPSLTPFASWTQWIPPRVGPTPNPSATFVLYDANGAPCDLPPIDIDREFCGIDFSASSTDELNQLADTHGLRSPIGAWLASPCDNVSGYSLDVFDQQSQENWAGAIVWSPDSRQLLYSGWNCSSQAGSDGLYSLMLVDVVRQTQRAVVSDKPQAYFPFRWDASGAVVRYSGPAGDTTAAWYYQFDVQTGALTRIKTTDLNPVPLFSN